MNENIFLLNENNFYPMQIYFYRIKIILLHFGNYAVVDHYFWFYYCTVFLTTAMASTLKIDLFMAFFPLFLIKC